MLELPCLSKNGKNNLEARSFETVVLIYEYTYDMVLLHRGQTLTRKLVLSLRFKRSRPKIMKNIS